jgi:hypothetical protein
LTASDGKFRATLLTITKVASVSVELMPFVRFRATLEERGLDNDDDVAIFNVHGTSSHFVIFLDTGKTMDEVEEELDVYSVVISREDHQRILTVLDSKAQYEAALGDLDPQS